MTLNAFPVNNYAFLFSDLGDPFVHRNSAALTRGIVLGDIHFKRGEAHFEFGSNRQAVCGRGGC